MMEQQTIKANLDGSPVINENAQYFVDFSKLERIEELILILAAMGINFNPKHPYFESLKHLLNLEQPMILENGRAPLPSEIKLPKISPTNNDNNNG